MPGEIEPKFKAATHAIAGVLTTWIAFGAIFVSQPGGQALVARWPKLTLAAGAVTAAAAAIAAYRQPK